MRTVSAVPIKTPHMLACMTTYVCYDDDGTRLFAFFVTHFRSTHMAIVRNAYRRGIQVAFRYYI